jgi:hypothetical protein
MKQFILPIIICFVPLICGFYISHRQKEARFTELKTSINLTVEELNNIEVYEYNYMKPLTLTYHRTFLADFDVTAMICGKIVYYITVDNIEFTRSTKESVNVAVTGKLGSRSYVDHHLTYFINPTWRYGYNEFQIADTVYGRAQSAMEDAAVQLADTAKASSGLIEILNNAIHNEKVACTVKLK